VAVKRVSTPSGSRAKKDQGASNMVKAITKTPIIWECGPEIHPDVWFSDSALTVHVSSNREDFTTYEAYTKSQDIKAFGNN